MIVFRESPDPDVDPRVQEILQEAEVRVHQISNVSNHVQNYDIGENFDYFVKDVNVVDDVEEDSDNNNNDNGSNDNYETINVTKKCSVYICT